MSWRTVVITKRAKLSYRNGNLIVRGEDVNFINLAEIHTLIIDSTTVSLTAYLISELLKSKIKVIFCDEKRNPQGEIVPYYGNHNSSKRIASQIAWSPELKEKVWTRIIYQKIMNQADHLKKLEIKDWDKIMTYLTNLKMGDKTNREGHAAKVYFNALFGKSFSREIDNDINAALNYGYSIILSCFNKEIAANGYLTQIGMKHKNEYNPFNLTSDIMEPFRVLIDEIVYQNKEESFNSKYKMELLNVLEKKLLIDGKEQYLTNAIRIYTKSIFNALEKGNLEEIKFFDYI